MLSAIVAISENNVIGKDGKLPWHLPEDLKFFREKTMGKKMIMGRKTFEALPKVLEGREHIVLTRDKTYTFDHAQVEVVHDLEALIEQYKQGEEVVVIGGSEIFEKLVGTIKRYYITLVHSNQIEGDVYLNLDFLKNANFLGASETKTDESSGLSYTFKTYEMDVE